MVAAIRDQCEADFPAVHELVIAAFKTLPIACGREQFVMDALWTSGAATVALVAEDGGEIVGQAAFSKATVGGQDVGWHGCGPVSVLPKRHKQGIGSAIVQKMLDWFGREKAKSMMVNVAVGNEDAFKFYKQWGFYPRVTALVRIKKNK